VVYIFKSLYCIRKKLEIFNTKGYNEEEHNAIIQRKRSEYLSNLTSMINVGLISSISLIKQRVIKKTYKSQFSLKIFKLLLAKKQTF